MLVCQISGWSYGIDIGGNPSPDLFDIINKMKGTRGAREKAERLYCKLMEEGNTCYSVQ